MINLLKRASDFSSKVLSRRRTHEFSLDVETLNQLNFNLILIYVLRRTISIYSPLYLVGSRFIWQMQ